MTPRTWYASMELRQGTQDWEGLTKKFRKTFEFVDEQSTVDVALQTIKEKIFIEIPVEEANSHQCSVTIQQWMACYNLVGDLDDDLTNINILELEGTRAVEGSGISSDQFLKPLKIKKVNIGSSENPKFANIGDYWDEGTFAKITDLLHEYWDVFPTIFLEMKRIVGDLWEMKIPLRTDAKPSKQLPYRLNPRYKEKVKAELDRMLNS